VQYRLIVRQVKTLQITRLYTCLDAIQHVEVNAAVSMHTHIILYIYTSVLPGPSLSARVLIFIPVFVLRDFEVGSK